MQTVDCCKTKVCGLSRKKRRNGNRHWQTRLGVGYIERIGEGASVGTNFKPMLYRVYRIVLVPEGAHTLRGWENAVQKVNLQIKPKFLQSEHQLQKLQAHKFVEHYLAFGSLVQLFNYRFVFFKLICTLLLGMQAICM